MKRAFRICALALLLTGCATRTPPGCEQLYVILPDNYIVDLAAGSRIILDPAMQEFDLFCSANSAKDALRLAALPGEWRVYSVDGSFDDITEYVGTGHYRLAQPVQVLDWVEL